MHADDAIQAQRQELAIALEQQVRECTHGRLHAVRVDLATDRLIVHGWANSQHVKQLALQAISSLGNSISIELDVHVVTVAPDDASGSTSTMPVIVPGGHAAADPESEPAPIDSEF